mmetsp:Transcript_14383/g.23745  ORF Transcript_14383/g.23745 Transcript_14383/m.23745 type:complete len:211 (+) Transcript_14383:69-701(+)
MTATTNDADDDQQQQPSSNKRCHSGEETSTNKRIKTESESVLATLLKSHDDDDADEGPENHAPNKRWRAHQMVEDYVDAVGRLVMPGTTMAPMVATQRVTALGYLTSPLRRGTVWEDWSPKEVALFEAALFHYGKEFAKMKHACLPHKTTKDVVAFYYVWKKTSHYQNWKKQYEPDEGAWVMDDNAIKAKTTSAVAPPPTNNAATTASSK